MGQRLMAAEETVDHLAPEELAEVRLRVSVELGRARVPVARAVSLGEGTIVELDREADEPIDIYVNGVRYGTGRLLLVEGDWAVRVEAVGDPADVLPPA